MSFKLAIFPRNYRFGYQDPIFYFVKKIKAGVYNVYCIKFIKANGEECQVVKRGKENHGCGEEYEVEKRESGINIIFPLLLRLLGRISSGERD